MSKDEILLKIDNLKREIIKIPYGHVLNKKQFPPNINRLKQILTELIDLAINLHNIDNELITLTSIEQLQSILVNQIESFKTDSKSILSEFNKYGVSHKLESITSPIEYILTFS